jgi:hypothetical protein
LARKISKSLYMKREREGSAVSLLNALILKTHVHKVYSMKASSVINGFQTC